jgi:hypothetical protein
VSRSGVALEVELVGRQELGSSRAEEETVGIGLEEGTMLVGRGKDYVLHDNRVERRIHLDKVAVRRTDFGRRELAAADNHLAEEEGMVSEIEEARNQSRLRDEGNALHALRNNLDRSYSRCCNARKWNEE